MQPTDQNAVAGATVTFAAAASGDPTPSVQWQLYTGGGAAWQNITGATSASYSFVASLSENGYYYRAVFTNGPESSDTSSNAVLTVQ
jgi:hypothetical protein